MKISNIEGVVNYLFPKGKLPCLVLAQDSCTRLRCRDSSRRLTTFMVPGTHKELLKNLDTLFLDYRGILNSGNITAIVDDTPLKHIMNRFENFLLPNLWSNHGNGERDTLWFQPLHLACDQKLKSFREHRPNRIGQKMLCDERNLTEYNKVMEVVQGSSYSFN